MPGSSKKNVKQERGMNFFIGWVVFNNDKIYDK